MNLLPLTPYSHLEEMVQNIEISSIYEAAQNNSIIDYREENANSI